MAPPQGPSMDSFPSFFKLSTSAMATHSPFPPLKVEHRYRGVYERAGFDVCRSPLPSPKSPAFPKGTHADARTAQSLMTKANETQNKGASPRLLTSPDTHQQPPHRGPASSLRHIVDLNANREYRHNMDMESLEHNASSLSNKCRSDSTSLHESQEKNASTSLVATSASLGCYQHAKSNRESAAMSCEFEFGDDRGARPKEPSFSAPVLLDVGSGAPSHMDYTQLSAPVVYRPTSPLEEIERPVTTFYGYRLKPDAHLGQTQSAKSHGRGSLENYNNSHSHSDLYLGTVYQGPIQSTHERPDSRADGEQPLFSNQRPFSKPTINTNHDTLPVAHNPFTSNDDHMLPTNLPYPAHEPRFSYLANSPRMPPPLQFQQFQYDASNNDHLNTPSPGLRHSQMSTVSSILSKGSIYDEDEEDEEVTKEMQRMLQTLKNGTYNSEQPAYPDHAMIPEIAVDDMSKRVVSHQRTTSEASSIAIPEKLALRPPAAPLIYKFDESYNERPRLIPNESERELRELLPLHPQHNVPAAPSTPAESQVPPRFQRVSRAIGVSELQWGDSDPSLLIDKELETMQRAITSPRDDQSTFTKNDDPVKDTGSVDPLRPHRHSVGKGPCRACGNDIALDARGPLKSIHSTTGELLGQWHRQCFSCSHQGCDIRFSKHVSCYAHNDMPYCQRHYHLVNGTICACCDQTIEGECIEDELKQKWHLQCLRCHKCNCTISHDYYNINGHLFCERDAHQIMRKESTAAGDYNAADLKIERRKTKLLMC